MSQVCEKCGKGPQVGRSVSHSNRKTLRRFNPNLVEKRLFEPATGKKTLVKICTKCLRTMAKD